MNEDALAKLGLQALLAPFVSLRVHHEVQPPAQFVDLFVSEAPSAPERLVQTLGLLGRMTCQPTLLEAFSDTLTLAEARDCLRKQLTLHHTLMLDTKRARERTDEVAFPWLWMLSLGRPRMVLEGWKLFGAPRWPAGVYRSGDELSVGVVVLRELEPTRETLALRLFGETTMRQQAVRELTVLSAEDPMRRAVKEMLYRWRVWLRGHPDDEAVRRRLMNFEEFEHLVQQDMQRLRDEGRQQGLETGRQQGRVEGRVEEARRAVARVMAHRGLGLSEALEARLSSCDELATLERWLEQSLTASTAEAALA